jgi:single-stranded-DNA-specific exonuclease
MGNPSPVFGIRDVEFEEPKIVGHGHLKGVLREGRHRLDAIGFNLAERSEGLLGGGRRVDAALRLEQNEFRGKSTLQARLLALTSADSLKPSDPQ